MSATTKGDDIMEERTSFSYHKMWRQRRVNSLLFDNALSYHNPQRDPCPGYTLAATAAVVLGDNLGARGTL